MPADAKKGRKSDSPKNKGINADLNKLPEESDLSNTDSDGVWKSPSKLKEEVQTIIDIMGPPLSPKFGYNTSSEADNEESIFTNSKISSMKQKLRCDCNDDSEKTDATDIPSKEEAPVSSAVADANTTTISTCLEDITEPKNHFPYEDTPYPQYICPPPMMPANVCLNSECFCPQFASLLQENPVYGTGNPISNVAFSTNGPMYENKPVKESKNALMNWLKTMVASSSHKCLGKDSHCEYYKMNVKKKRGDDSSPPRRVVFELVQNQDHNLNCPPTKSCFSSKERKNIDNEKTQELETQTNFQEVPTKDGDRACFLECSKMKKPIEKTTYCDTSGKTRVDVYYFDHGSFNHYRTTDSPPLVTTECVADKTEKHTTRFWAEIFGTIHIGFSFFTSFILQFFRFLLYSIFRPLTIGLIQLASDYFFKPLLATIFNGVLQPILIFFFNIATSIRDLCDPISEGVGYFLREFAALVRAFRIVEVTTSKCSGGECKCEKKVKKSKCGC